MKSEDDVRTSNKPNAGNVTKEETFGQTARPSTPMWDLLEHKFSKTWKEEVKARELMRKEMQQSVRQKIAPKKGKQGFIKYRRTPNISCADTKN